MSPHRENEPAGRPARFSYRWWGDLLPVVLIALVWLVFFWPMLTGEMIAGYRDSTYWYYPLFQWIDWQMEQGEFPLWMPFENTGFPLLADGTSSLLYPGKAIFWLRSLSFPARYGWFLALHVLWAAAGGYAMAKTLGANPWGAALAGISYAFGGSVVFQVCNVVYLVSASWLPWALTCVWKMSDDLGQGARWAIAGSVCCSMMILGGDPQMVYHVGLIALVTLVAKRISGPSSKTLPVRFYHLTLLVLCTSLLAAVQLLPTIEWASYSDRANSDVPMNVWHGDFNALVHLPDRPPVSDVYQFSQEPWSLVGMLFPNFFGYDAPINSRWSAAFPGAERIWVPSNYLGGVAFLLALSSIRFWRGKTPEQGRAVRVWLSWIAIWFVAASFGWYGAGWLLAEAGWSTATVDDGTIQQPVGGLYWLMVTLLPKYCLFRYPAKLMVVGCLAISVLAGISLKPRGIARLKPLAWMTAVVGFLGVIGLFVPQTIVFLKSCQTTTLFGPFQFEASWYSILFSLLSTTGCCLLVLVAAGCCRAATTETGDSQANRLRWACGAIVILVAIELTAQNRWMLHPIAAKVMTTATSTEQTIKMLQERRSTDAGDSEPAELVVSVMETNFQTDSFLTNSSSQRIAELATWRREILFPKMHLLIKDVRLWGSFTSIWPIAFEGIRQADIDAEAHIINRRDEAIVDAEARDRANHPWKHPRKHPWVERARWSGQEFRMKVRPSKGGEGGSLRLPIFPMPGWEAHFSSPDSSPEVGAEAVTSIKPAGPLYSSASVPEQFLGKACEVRCAYRPACFRWGATLSGLGWLGVSVFWARCFWYRKAD